MLINEHCALCIVPPRTPNLKKGIKLKHRPITTMSMNNEVNGVLKVNCEWYT